MQRSDEAFFFFKTFNKKNQLLGISTFRKVDLSVNLFLNESAADKLVLVNRIYSAFTTSYFLRFKIHHPCSKMTIYQNIQRFLDQTAQTLRENSRSLLIFLSGFSLSYYLYWNVFGKNLQIQNQELDKQIKHVSVLSSSPLLSSSSLLPITLTLLRERRNFVTFKQNYYL